LAGEADMSIRIETGEYINFLVLVKGSERYAFAFTDENRQEVLRTLGRFAVNPELSFSWYDAAVLSQRVRQEAEAREQEYRK
jgi:hypothetical protein